MDLKDKSKNRKVSIHNKYTRRLRRLSFSVEEFLKLAEMKLDRSLSGDVHNRAEIEQIEMKCRELAALLADSKDDIDSPSSRDNFFEVRQ